MNLCIIRVIIVVATVRVGNIALTVFKGLRYNHHQLLKHHCKANKLGYTYTTLSDFSYLIVCLFSVLLCF